MAFLQWKGKILMDETSYLLSTEANSQWILDSIAEADSGQFIALEFPITMNSKSNET
jgi:hypothetical protein